MHKKVASKMAILKGNGLRYPRPAILIAHFRAFLKIDDQQTRRSATWWEAKNWRD